MVLVRERERGTWEGLLATPVRPGEALVGKLAPYLVIGVGQTAILIAVIHLLFQVPLPIQGWALIAASTLLAGAYLILGFALSAITQNQLQAVQAAVGVYLPSLLLSGFLFPFQTMPGWAQAVGRLLPLTYYIRATRSLLIRDEPLSTLPADLWPIALFGLASLVVALLAYRRRLD
jgi:ABC-2 type transport system permease protein